MEKQEELSSLPYDFGNRLYDPRRGQFPTRDKLASQFPWQSPYVFAGNTPIQAIDINGDAAWVVIKTTNGNKTQIQMKFDKDLINPGGVYFIHKWVDPNNPSFVTSVSTGTQNYSEYPKQFPNFAKGNYEKFHPMDIIKSFSIEGEANILFGEGGLEGHAAGAGVGGSVGVNGKIIGLNFNTNDNSGYVPLFGWQSSFRKNDKGLDVGGGLSYGAGIEYRHKYDLRTNNFKDDNSIKYNGIVTSVDVNGYTNETNLSWGIGGKAALGFGINADLKLNLNMNKFTNALNLLKTKFTSYEQKQLGNQNTGTKELDPSKY